MSALFGQTSRSARRDKALRTAAFVAVLKVLPAWPARRDVPLPLPTNLLSARVLRDAAERELRAPLIAAVCEAIVFPQLADGVALEYVRLFERLTVDPFDATARRRLFRACRATHRFRDGLRFVRLCRRVATLERRAVHPHA